MSSPRFVLPSDEREAVQKKTFTKWVNLILSRVGCRISDLYLDLRDGRMLIKLLEVLSGERLVRKSNLTFLCFSLLFCIQSCTPLCLSWCPPAFVTFCVSTLFLLFPTSSRNPPKAECVSTVWRTWTRLCSSSRSRGSTWRTWGPTTSSTATTASSSASSGPSSFASR